MNSFPDYENYRNIKIPSDINLALSHLRSITGNTMDLNIMEAKVSDHHCAVVSIEAMASTMTMGELIFKPLCELKLPENSKPTDIFDYLTKESLLSSERATVYDYGEVMVRLFSGFVLVLVNGIASGQVYGVQGFDKRAITEPTSDINVLGGRDGFIEQIRTNISLVRRRMKTPSLRFELMRIGSQSNTDVCIAYMADRATPELIESVRRRLSSIKLESVLTSGYVAPFLSKSKRSLFSCVQTTDSPDSFRARLLEGKVGIIIDGTPFALLVPSFFVENFNTIDDYANRPYYVFYIRLIKYVAFFLSVMLPGIYVALATFHSETFTYKLLLSLVVSEQGTPYPLVFDITIITLMYEILREAGIRMPKNIGGAVSIVGGLIIGDAAVNSGLISAPILIIIGLTATASFVIPTLNQQTSILRIVMIIAGGISGLYGISLVTTVLIANICSLDDIGIPYSAPVSPFFKKGIKNLLMRSGFHSLQRGKTLVSDFEAQKQQKEN